MAASFQTASESLKHKDLEDRIDRTWPVLLEGQQCVFSAWTQVRTGRSAAMLLWLTACFARGGQYHLAREHADKFEYGQQVARLSMASRLLTEMANESSRQAQPADLIACYQEAFETIDKASHAASHANDNVYMERVPSFETLPTVAPKSIVKPMPGAIRASNVRCWLAVRTQG